MMDKSSSHIPVTRKSLFFWAFRGNLKIQLLLLLLILGTVFFRVIPLEMQKRIINEAIVLHKGDSLLLYCAIYFVAVTATSIIKFGTNYLQATIGERAILAMREELYSHIITLPLHFFRNTQPGMVVSSLMTELNTAGTFAGMALAVPLSNILTLLAFAGYLFWLNPKLALATLGIYPIVVFLIPYLQKKTNRLNKQRVDQSRLVASQIAESITGVTEINVHGAYAEEKRKFNDLVEVLRNIRTKWSLLRFGIKTVNNYFVGLGPFVVFLFGGYLVMNGQLELGSMVAFLSAQEKLYDPWKELIEYYQVYQDASVRYHRVMQHFDLPAEDNPAIAMEPLTKLAGHLKVSNLGYTTANGIPLLKGVSVSLQAGEHMALVGFSGSGKSTLVHCIAKMFDYSSGSILLDNREVKNISKKELIRHVGYISQHPFIFSGTIRENLLYAHRAANSIESSSREEYQPPSLDHLILSLQQAGFFVDVIRFGLNSFLAPSETEMIAKVIRIRKRFREDYKQSLGEHIEFYRENHYLHHASITENIIFSTPATGSSSYSSLAADPQFKTFLYEMALTDSLLSLGIDLVRQSVNFNAAEDGVELSSGITPIPPDQLGTYRILLNRLGEKSPNHLPSADQNSLLGLALQFTSGHHKLVTIQPELSEKIVQCRKAWKEWSEKTLPDQFNPFQTTRYIQEQSILNNILFGRIKTEHSSIQEKISQDIIRLLIEEDCLESIAEAGMEHHLGSMGNKLSGGQKQKLAIARVLLKEPEVILMDESTSALDNKSQARIQRLIEQRWRNKRTVIAVVHRLDSIEGFNKIAVMKEGKLAEFGTYSELIEQKGLLYELVFERKEA
jgi:ABC-type multidrug transport system fused ATPase/permease subunit